MLRRRFTVFATLPLLLCVAPVALRVRSYRACSAYGRSAGGREREPVTFRHTAAGMSRGGLTLVRERGTLHAGHGGILTANHLRSLAARSPWKRYPATSYPVIEGSDVPALARLGLSWT